jgi:uncharacterized protein YqeY
MQDGVTIFRGSALMQDHGNQGCEMIRERLSGDLKAAIKADDAHRAATLRLICATIKDRDNAAQAGDNVSGVSDADIMNLLARMVGQREQSIASYEEAGQLDLAEQERGEIRILKDYLPRQMSEREVDKAISDAVARTGASSVRDINRVMKELKANYIGQMDFNRACTRVKNAFR